MSSRKTRTSIDKPSTPGSSSEPPRKKIKVAKGTNEDDLINNSTEVPKNPQGKNQVEITKKNISNQLIAIKMAKLQRIRQESSSIEQDLTHLKAGGSYLDLYPGTAQNTPSNEQPSYVTFKPFISALTNNESNLDHPPSALTQLIHSKQINKQPSLDELLNKKVKLRQRLEQLQKESGRKLNKSAEPPRNKVHWDYLLEEMEWMAKDFARERKWKVALAKKLVRLVDNYHSRNKTKEYRLKKQEELNRRRLALHTSRLIKNFWSKVIKLIQIKQNAKVEAKRKLVLDKSLDVLVDQTERYTNGISRSLSAQGIDMGQQVESENEIDSFKKDIENLSEASDDEMDVEHNEFVAPANLCEEVEDDETTLEEAEKMTTMEDIQTEIQNLEREKDIPIEELLENYNYLELNNIESNFELSDNEFETELSESEISESEYEHDWGAALLRENDRNKKLNVAAATAKAAQPTGTTLSSSKVKTPVPFLLRHGILREYQHIGLDWLVTMYENNLNGILADEMGLGKTIMTIAMLAHLACEKEIWGPHLVVVPTSVMLNWETEFKRWLPGFKILCYYGKASERKQKRQGWSKPNSFHVCITSYQLILQDQNSFKRIKWHYLILDEAQNIKNFKSQRWQTLLTFKSTRRLLLTGTPLQNNLMELWSLMHFLMPHVFTSQKEFKEWFSNPVSSMIEGKETVNKLLITRLHSVLRPFLLRRLKKDVEKQLPNKYEHISICKLSKRQRYLYEDFMNSNSTLETLSSKNYLGLMNVLMQLRKVCNHPDIFASRPIISPFDMQPICFNTASIVTKALKYSPLEHLSHSLLEIFTLNSLNQMYSWENSEMKKLSVPSKMFQVLSPGMIQQLTSSLSSTPHNLISFHKDHLDKLKSDKLIILSHHKYINEIRCRYSPIYSYNLLSHLTFLHPIYHIHKIKNSFSNFWSYPNTLLHMILLPDQRAQQLANILDYFVCVCPKVRAFSPIIHVSSPDPSEIIYYKRDLSLWKSLSPISTTYRNIQVRQQLYFPDKRLLQYDCGKLQYLTCLLTKLKADNHRCVIFTQMTRMLDILESFVNFNHWTYFRMDGSTKPEERHYLIEKFNNNSKPFIFILSTRTGGLGINLTGADTVIFYDTDWNPAIDAQAQDRCHRIGQTREVHIYRLVNENTVEENILKKANQKRQLDNLVINQGQYTTETINKNSAQTASILFEGLNTVSDLRFILTGNQTETEIQNEPTVSSKDIEKAMIHAEDATDSSAADKVLQEQLIDQNEFSSNNPTISTGLLSLLPIERFAIQYMEDNTYDISSYQIAILDHQLQIQQQKLLETSEQSGDNLSQSNRTRIIKNTRVDSGIQSELFFGVAGSSTEASYRSYTTMLEQNSFLCDLPLIEAPKHPSGDTDEIFIKKHDYYSEDWGLLSSPNSLSKMFKKPRRKPKHIPIITPLAGGLSIVSTPTSLTVRIPRVKIKGWYARRPVRTKRDQIDNRLQKRSLQPPKDSIGQKTLTMGYGVKHHEEEHVSWTREEDNLILSGVDKYGQNWFLISDILNSDTQVSGRLRQPPDIQQRWSNVMHAKTPHERDALYVDLQNYSLKKRLKQKDEKRKSYDWKGSFLPIGLGTPAVFDFIIAAMKRINGERQACKGALRASLSQNDDQMAKAMLQVAHNSHKKALTDAQQRLGAPSNTIGKVLLPTEIVEFRNIRNQKQKTEPNETKSSTEPFLKVLPAETRLTPSQLTTNSIPPYALLGSNVPSSTPNSRKIANRKHSIPTNKNSKQQKSPIVPTHDIKPITYQHQQYFSNQVIQNSNIRNTSQSDSQPIPVLPANQETERIQTRNSNPSINLASVKNPPNISVKTNTLTTINTNSHDNNIQKYSR